MIETKRSGLVGVAWGALVMLFGYPFFGVITLHLSSSVDVKETVTTYKLQALQTGLTTEASGSFLYFTQEEKPVARYLYVAENGSTRMDELPASDIEVYEDSEEATLRIVKREKSDISVVGPFVKIDETTNEFHLPEGTIVNYYYVSP